jgi:hypothetical protein
LQNYYLPSGYVTDGSAFWVYGVYLAPLVLLLGFVIQRWFAHAGAAKQAQQDEERPPKLAPGRAFLCGVVETDDARPAISLTLFEEGREWKNKGSWYHQWAERSRAVEVRPFTLVLASGERVRVLPDEHVAFKDTMAVRMFTGTERERVAELVAGERACIAGVLLWNRGPRQGQVGGVYRSGEAAPWVLRRGRTEPLLVAVGGLSAGHARWAKWYRKATLALGLAIAALHGGLFFTHHALRAAGEVMPARVIGQRTYITSTKSSRTTHYVVQAEVELGAGRTARVEGDVNRAIYNEAREKRLVQVPFLVVRRLPRIHQVGVKPATTVTRLVLATFGLVIALVLFWWYRQRATPWYEQRRVRLYGSGTLTQSVQQEEAAARAGKGG